ncbi:MAG: polyprenyl diphosphate synthase [Candidatus Altiarchaeota archaeon]|nr:polyprenyl diphosphate synthase [Candidatus Altiarchaeota archaeon]
MHIGVIPDGNRRYMIKKGIKNLLNSYDMGITRFFDFLEWCRKLGVNEVTIYALSIENIKNRSKDEIHTLLKTFNQHALSALKDKRIHKNKIRIQVCGDMDYLLNNGVDRTLSQKVVDNLRKLEESTKDYGNMKLNLAIAYGGRQEILHSVKELVKSKLKITEDNLRKHLWVKDYPDLVIRTSEERLSNFLTWQSAYSEIYFVNKLWQELEERDLVNIIDDYNARERRFGG